MTYANGNVYHNGMWKESRALLTIAEVQWHFPKRHNKKESSALVKNRKRKLDLDEDDGDDIEVTGERSWQERDQELRKHAIELD